MNENKTRMLRMLTGGLLVLSLAASGILATRYDGARAEETSSSEQMATLSPTPTLTPTPTPEPTEEPTPEPTEEPTPEPTEEPTPEPTEAPVSMLIAAVKPARMQEATQSEATTLDYKDAPEALGLKPVAVESISDETDDETLTKWLREFPCDDHRFWPADPDSPQAQLQGKQWEQLGRQTQLSMEESGQHAGENAGARALQAQVQASRSRRSYRDFLRRFAVWHEEPHLDPEEFDLGFYSYGLRVYGNLPLIEPLESREVKKIRDFVIVLDTSESTAGELVKAFLQETFTLLKSQDSFFRKCRILVLQADNAIQDETWLTDLDALDRYTANFTLHGGGGTDFRPAFARIAELREQGELRDLQGVLYFTDGKGIYPAHRPPFETAFLFLEDGAPPPEVPPWAMRLILQPEEFEQPPQHKAPPKG